ncbi:MAG: DUF1622 domain-containing protein [Desulfovibrionales bacterium]
MEYLRPFAHFSAGILELIGIGFILVYAFDVVWLYVKKLRKGGKGDEQIFQESRQRIGRGILLGLEFLVGADIIFTVAIEFTFTSVGVLTVLVLIRTFLSFSIELEINGRLPWQNSSK